MKPAWVLAALCAACRPAPTGLTAEHARAIADSVRNTFAAYVERFNARDVDSVMRFYSDAPDFQWIQDGQLSYSSRSEIRPAIESLRAFKDIRFSADAPRIVALAPGAASLAFTFDQALVDSAGGGVGVVGAMSIAAVHTPAGWKWRAGHSSLRHEPVRP